MSEDANRRRLVDHLQRTAEVVFGTPVDEATRRAAEETADLMRGLRNVALEPNDEPFFRARTG